MVAERGLAAYRALECRDACRLDFRSDAAGEPVFLEANPIAGLHPTHSDLPILSGLARPRLRRADRLDHRWPPPAATASVPASTRQRKARSKDGDIRMRHDAGVMGRKPFIPVVHAATVGRPDEQDTVIAAAAVAAALARLGHRTEVIGIGSDLDRIDALKRRSPLAVFNLVEAIDGDCRKQWLATARLDRKRIAYTGCDTRALKATASKLDCKGGCSPAGLPTPAWLDGRR